MEFAVLGWPDEGPRLRLDYRRFSYAGKFVMTTTGKAVALAADAGLEPEAVVDRSDGKDPILPDEEHPVSEAVLAAVAFNADRTDPGRLWLRYVTVRADCRGRGIGPRLVAFVCDRASDRGYERARIAVNNPFAYHALYRAGFGYTGEETGIAELVLERALGGDRGAASDPDRYRAGLAVFANRDLGDSERTFVERKRETGPPDDTLAGGAPE